MEMSSRKRLYCVAVILAFTLAAGSLPLAFLAARDTSEAGGRIFDIIETSVKAGAELFSATARVGDEVTRSRVRDLRGFINAKGSGSLEADRYIEHVCSQSYSIWDILITETDGMVVAGARPDSPVSVSGVLSSLKRPLSEEIFCAASFSEPPYEKFMIPYVTGIDPDGAGGYKRALIVFMRGDLFDDAIDKITIAGSRSFVMVTDRDGTVISSRALSGKIAMTPLERGQRLPLEFWQRLKAGDDRITLETRAGKFYTGVSVMRDAKDEISGSVIFAADASWTEGMMKAGELFTSVGAARYAIFAIAAYLIGLAVTVYIYEGVRPASRSLEREGSGDALSDAARNMFDHDSLTGALSRRKGIDELEVRCREADETGEPLSLVLTDVDDLKGINNSYGPAVGDAALRFVSASIAEKLAADDRVARSDGDEFLVMLPGCDAKAAHKVWEEIEKHVATLSVYGLGVGAELKLNAVVRQYRHGENPSSLVKEMKDEKRRKGAVA